MKSLIEDDKLFIENGPTNIIAEAFSSEKKEIYNLICEYSSKFFRIINEIPTILMIFIIILVVIKPWS